MCSKRIECTGYLEGSHSNAPLGDIIAETADVPVQDAETFLNSLTKSPPQQNLNISP